MGTLLVEIIVFGFLLGIFQETGIMWIFQLFLALHVVSGVWKNRPITLRLIGIGLLVHVVAPIAGYLSLLISFYMIHLGEFAGILTSYLVAGLVYFCGNLMWSWRWRIGAAIGTTLVMAIGYLWFLPLTGWNGFASYILFPMLLWRVTELGYVLIKVITDRT